MLLKENCFAGVDWPDAKTQPEIIRTEREIRKKLKRRGLGLVCDRTGFTDSHFCGGYAIVSETQFLAGRNFDLTLPDVFDWMRDHLQKQVIPIEDMGLFRKASGQ